MAVLSISSRIKNALTARTYRFSFGDSGRLFVADVGQARMEEIDLVRAGGNYGWPIREGTGCFNAGNWNQPLERCAANGLSEPILSYSHEGDLSAIIGGGIYRGKAIPELAGDYIFGDWGRGNGHLFVAYPPSLGIGSWKFEEIQIVGEPAGIGQLLTIEEDKDGEFYLLTKAPGTGPMGNSGLLYKIVPAGNP
jgi:glucose/arabinose dehydrogenase